jgi:site-specific DNA-methyltransferase (adenine-specific)
MIATYYKSDCKDFLLAKGDCLQLLPNINFKFDMIFADPPYFLSNGGISLQNGKVVCVDKGEWDKGKSQDEIHDFNRTWLKLCQEKLKENGTIWISGTYHNIFSVANALVELGYKILNVITWQKSNPPANISCRFFTYSTEFVIWARKNPKKPHKFNYDLMKRLNENKQMTDVWKLPAIGRWEKTLGKHPTQKPLSLLTRIILASTDEDDWVLDPFSGSSTTGIAANLCNRRFCGLEQEDAYCQLSRNRRELMNDIEIRTDWERHIADMRTLKNLSADGLWKSNERNVSYNDAPFDL